MAGTTKTRPYNAANAGALSLAEAEITFAAADAAQLLASVPAGAVIIDAWIEVTEAFNSGTSDTLSIGWGAVGGPNDGAILDSVNGQSTGVAPATRGIPAVKMAAAQDINVYADTEGTAPTAGAASAFIVYALTADNGESNGFYGA